ncbi:hypothetical protein F5883DRAFT_650570 [Diaporthe sp. PMI_573]|nr:hypothetical protein F5883DRAFT_650570 [Diaporthaceae sp. PMI_573]
MGRSAPWKYLQPVHYTLHPTVQSTFLRQHRGMVIVFGGIVVMPPHPVSTMRNIDSIMREEMDATAANTPFRQGLFDRLLKIQILSAISGTAGGSTSDEFLAPCKAGQDTYIHYLESGYITHVEAIITTLPPAQPVGHKPKVDTQTQDYAKADTLESIVKLPLPGLKKRSCSR